MGITFQWEKKPDLALPYFLKADKLLENKLPTILSYVKNRIAGTYCLRKEFPLALQYINEAIEIEKAGLKVAFKKEPEPVPEELQNKLKTLLETFREGILAEEYIEGRDLAVPFIENFKNEDDESLTPITIQRVLVSTEESIIFL